VDVPDLPGNTSITICHAMVPVKGAFCPEAGRDIEKRKLANGHKKINYIFKLNSINCIFETAIIYN
jgi:hypothetical protein